MLIPARYEKALNENHNCANARLVRMVKWCVEKSICDRCMPALTDGVRVYVCNLSRAALTFITLVDSLDLG